MRTAAIELKIGWIQKLLLMLACLLKIQIVKNTM